MLIDSRCHELKSKLTLPVKGKGVIFQSWSQGCHPTIWLEVAEAKTICHTHTHGEIVLIERTSKRQVHHAACWVTFFPIALPQNSPHPPPPTPLSLSDDLLSFALSRRLSRKLCAALFASVQRTYTVCFTRTHSPFTIPELASKRARERCCIKAHEYAQRNEWTVAVVVIVVGRSWTI